MGRGSWGLWPLGLQRVGLDWTQAELDLGSYLPRIHNSFKNADEGYLPAVVLIFRGC